MIFCADAHTRGSARCGLRRPRTDDDSFGRLRRGHRHRTHRQERRVRLRLLETRRDVRTPDAGRGPSSVSRHRQTGRTISADHGAVHRPGRPARGHRRGNVRGGHPGSSARRRPRSRRHARARRRRQRVLHGCGSLRVARRAPALRTRPGHHRRHREILQVPSRSQRDGAAAARLPHRARAARGHRNLGGDALRHAHSALARHLARDPRRVRGARHQVREG